MKSKSGPDRVRIRGGGSGWGFGWSPKAVSGADFYEVKMVSLLDGVGKLPWAYAIGLGQVLAHAVPPGSDASGARP